MPPAASVTKAVAVTCYLVEGCAGRWCCAAIQPGLLTWHVLLCSRPMTQRGESLRFSTAPSRVQQGRERRSQAHPRQPMQQSPEALPQDDSHAGAHLQPMPGEPTEEQVALAFAKYDPDGTTFISSSQLGSLMAELGMPLSPNQLKQASEQLDRTGSGQVSFGEFLLWWKG